MQATKKRDIISIKDISICLLPFVRHKTKENGSMLFNLKETRLKYGYSIDEMAKFTEIMPIYYAKYEEEGEIPSKYIYRLWLKLPDFPVPNDFFDYTSHTLMVNMKLHNMTQSQIAKMFGMSNQSTISSMLSQNIPMYELKECFHNFQPLFIPKIKIEQDNYIAYENLVVKGNFIAKQRKQKTKEKRELEKQNELIYA